MIVGDKVGFIIKCFKLFMNCIYALLKVLRKKTNKKIVFWYSNPLKQEGVNLLDLKISKEYIEEWCEILQ